MEGHNFTLDTLPDKMLEKELEYCMISSWQPF